MRIEKERWRDSTGNVVVDIHVADTSELPALGASIGDGSKIAATSYATTKDGTFYKLDETGDWYKQDGSGDKVTPSEGE